MTNVYVDYEAVHGLALSLRERASAMALIMQNLNDTTVRIGQSWQDTQFEEFCEDTMALMTFMDTFIEQCRIESDRLGRIAEAAAKIRYSS